MADIAARVGVSTVTVSKALAGKEGVSQEIREKIRALAREMGYNSTPSNTRLTKKTGNIGILIPVRFVEKDRSFYWRLYERIVQKLTDNGYYGILEMVQSGEEQKLSEPHILQDRKIDGLVLMGQVDAAYREMLRGTSPFPVVFLDAYDVFNGNDCVISDGYHGMCVVTQYLVQLGHRKICFVGSLNVTSSINDRYSGFCRAMLEYGLAVTPSMILPDRAEGDVRVELPDSLLHNMPTAFVCNCDVTAGLLIRELRTRGIRVPEDVSVTGFDDYVYPGMENLDVTTYSVDMNNMAQACVNRMLHKLENPRYTPGLKTVSGKLIVRSTTGPART